jgi:hypothetical protein
MTALTLATCLALAALPAADPAPLVLDPLEPGALERPTLELGPIPSLLPSPPADSLLAAAPGVEPSSEEKTVPRRTGIGRRRVGVAMLLSSLVALGASYAVMPLADATAPNDSPNQGAMALRLELVVLSAGAAVVGGYLLVSSF